MTQRCFNRGIAIGYFTVLLLAVGVVSIHAAPCEVSTPREGDVFFRGEPFAFTSEYNCTHSQDGPFTRCGGSLTGLETSAYLGMREATSETLRIHVPGRYVNSRYMQFVPSAITLSCGGFFEVIDCPTFDPPSEPDPAAPAPKLEFRFLSEGPQLLRVLFTHDNSHMEGAYLELVNEGDADLVVTEVGLVFDYGGIVVGLEGVPLPLRLPPGTRRVGQMRVQVIDEPAFRYHIERSFQTIRRPEWGDALGYSFHWYIRSNEPDHEYHISYSNSLVFKTKSDIPPELMPAFTHPDPLPTNPACGDWNSDGMMDAADVVKSLLGGR